jgi:hypothetical protein
MEHAAAHPPQPSSPPEPVPPTVLDAHGRPRVGTYAGVVPGVSWRGAAGPLRRRLAQKTWQFAGVYGAGCVVGVAIVDLGWAATAWCYLWDRQRRELVVDRSFTGVPTLHARVAPQAGEGTFAEWRSKSAYLAIERPPGAERYRVIVRVPGLDVDVSLGTAGAPPTMCAIAVPAGGVGNCTHKTVGLPVTGTASAGGRRYVLDGSTALLDHTCGVLARDTRWHWAAAARPGLALNLVEGFNGPVENVVWHGASIIPVGAVRFTFDRARPLEPWTIVSEGGELELTFQPEGQRAEDKDLVVAASRYVQPIGTFRGRIRAGGADLRIEELLGVTEDHAARW